MEEDTRKKFISEVFSFITDIFPTHSLYKLNSVISDPVEIVHWEECHPRVSLVFTPDIISPTSGDIRIDKVRLINSYPELSPRSISLRTDVSSPLL